MTKKEWFNLKPGDRVWTKHNDLQWANGECKFVDRYLTGIVSRINSNRSQALVDWGDIEKWHGRLSIELIDSFPKNI
jgi:hypothetical protein